MMMNRFVNIVLNHSGAFDVLQTQDNENDVNHNASSMRIVTHSNIGKIIVIDIVS